MSGFASPLIAAPPQSAAGAPTTGTWLEGQMISDSNDATWLCTDAGTPGTWVQVMPTGGGLLSVTATDGSIVVGGSATAPTVGIGTIGGGATVATSQTTTSATYADLATVGPAVTLTTGTLVLVIIGCNMAESTLGAFSLMSYAVSGATTTAASDAWAMLYQSAVATDQIAASMASVQTVTAGSNVFTAKYRVNANTGTFFNRWISVLRLN